jgi:hypothetical protein
LVLAHVDEHDIEGNVRVPSAVLAAGPVPFCQFVVVDQLLSLPPPTQVLSASAGAAATSSRTAIAPSIADMARTRRPLSGFAAEVICPGYRHSRAAL